MSGQRELTQYETDQLSGMGRRLERWVDALIQGDDEVKAEQSASLAAMVIHIGQVAGADDIHSRMFRSLDRLDARKARRDQEED